MSSLLDLLLASKADDVVVKDNQPAQLQGKVANNVLLSVGEELFTWLYVSVRGYIFQ